MTAEALPLELPTAAGDVVPPCRGCSSPLCPDCNPNGAPRVITEPQTCNYCDGRIVWLQTRNGKFMPVDEQPTDTGNILRSGRHAGVLGKNQAAAARAAGARLHLHHAVTCPHAAKWQAKGSRR